MATKTLLEYVNAVLSEMDSRRVTSTNETDESDTVRDIMESVFYELQAVRPYRRAKQYKGGTFAGLTQTGISYCLYTLPQDIVQLDELWYISNDAKQTRTQLQYLFPQDFIELQNRLNLEMDGVSIDVPDPATGNGRHYIYTDRAPKYYTSFDDNLIAVDAYESSEHANGAPVNFFDLRYSKEINFPASDGDDFDQLPQDVMQLVLLTTKHRAMIALKNVNNSAIERQMVKLDRYLSRQQKVVGDDFPMANYGRHSAKPSSNWKFSK